MAEDGGMGTNYIIGITIDHIDKLTQFAAELASIKKLAATDMTFRVKLNTEDFDTRLADIESRGGVVSPGRGKKEDGGTPGTPGSGPTAQQLSALTAAIQELTLRAGQPGDPTTPVRHPNETTESATPAVHATSATPPPTSRAAAVPITGPGWKPVVAEVRTLFRPARCRASPT